MENSNEKEEEYEDCLEGNEKEKNNEINHNIEELDKKEEKNNDEKEKNNEINLNKEELDKKEEKEGKDNDESNENKPENKPKNVIKHENLTLHKNKQLKQDIIKQTKKEAPIQKHLIFSTHQFQEMFPVSFSSHC